jgi:hypothetical protein
LTAFLTGSRAIETTRVGAPLSSAVLMAVKVRAGMAPSRRLGGPVSRLRPATSDS